ncbi:UNVERIFIED_CONTAM: hypothetical protein FKN15_038613 [Acipenser sinensis]
MAVIILYACDSLARSSVVDDVTDQELTETKTVDGRVKLSAIALSVFNKQNKRFKQNTKQKGTRAKRINKQTNNLSAIKKVLRKEGREDRQTGSQTHRQHPYTPPNDDILSN